MGYKIASKKKKNTILNFQHISEFMCIVYVYLSCDTIICAREGKRSFILSFYIISSKICGCI